MDCCCNDIEKHNQLSSCNRGCVSTWRQLCVRAREKRPLLQLCEPTLSLSVRLLEKCVGQLLHTVSYCAGHHVRSPPLQAMLEFQNKPTPLPSPQHFPRCLTRRGVGGTVTPLNFQKWTHTHTPLKRSSNGTDRGPLILFTTCWPFNCVSGSFFRKFR